MCVKGLICVSEEEFLTRNSTVITRALKCKTLGGIHMQMLIILRMRVECLAAPCRPSPVSRLFHTSCTSS